MSGISLGQAAYAIKLLEKSGMAGCNPSLMPMEARLKLSKQSTEMMVDVTATEALSGAWRYLINTHLDLAFVVGYVSWFLEEPREDHLATVSEFFAMWREPIADDFGLGSGTTNKIQQC